MKCKNLRAIGKTPGKIVASGQGGFLNPPTHPEHSFSVRSIHGFSFGISLESAATETWLDDSVRLAARRMLDRWKRPEIESETIQAWIKEVLAYFRNCYGADPVVTYTFHVPTNWNASKLVINADADPVANADLHAGVHFVRKYYPEYVPKADDFTGTWGAK
jgi:hypothetical protein